MGSLILPPSGPVYADTQILIYSVEKHPVYGPLLRTLWEGVRAGTVEAVTSELAVLETLVGPLKKGDADLASDYEQLFQQAGLRLLPITQPILREAARLRATIPSLRTPDAVHAATALVFQSSLFITNDPAFRRVSGLSLAVLSDLAT